MRYLIPVLVLLGGCANQPVIVHPNIPDFILKPCSETKVDIKNNSDLLLKTLYLKSDLALCSAKQKALADSLQDTPKPVK